MTRGFLFNYDSLLQNATDIIKKCDSYFITKCDRSLLQNVSGLLLQNTTVITKYDANKQYTGQNSSLCLAHYFTLNLFFIKTVLFRDDVSGNM